MKKLIAITSIALSSIVMSQIASACCWDPVKRTCGNCGISFNGIEKGLQTPTCDLSKQSLSVQQ